MGNIFFAYTRKKNQENVASINEAIFKYKKENSSIVTSWENLKEKGKIINERILKAINENDVFACDLTYLNRNVLFELGYAIGKNKKILIFLNPNIISAKQSYENFEVLRNIDYETYTKSDDILSKFNNALQIEEFEKFDNDNFDLLFIKRKIENETSSEILKLKLPFNFISDDRILNYEIRKWYFNNINQSKNIILLFKGSDIINNQYHNAEVSLLAGLGCGLGKKVLLLAPKSFKKPIDYENILINYNDHFDCINVIKKWIDDFIINQKYYYGFMDEKSFGMGKYSYYNVTSNLTIPLSRINFLINERKYSLEKSNLDSNVIDSINEKFIDYLNMAKSKGISCFNGGVTRLKKFKKKLGNKVDIVIQELDYFDYIKSHLIADIDLNNQLDYKTFRDYITSKPKLYLKLARPLGINILLITKNDRRILLQKRSGKTNIYPNTICPTASGTLQFNDALLLSKMNQGNEEIKKIILSREVYEETGILPSNIYNLEFIGCFEDRFRLNTPDIFFLGWADLSSDIIINKYNEGKVKDKFESKELITCKINDFINGVFTNNFEEQIAQTLRVYLLKKEEIRNYLKHNKISLK